eukprot:365877-Chlamydomonas_euryale.AAC.2
MACRHNIRLSLSGDSGCVPCTCAHCDDDENLKVFWLLCQKNGQCSFPALCHMAWATQLPAMSNVGTLPWAMQFRLACAWLPWSIQNYNQFVVSISNVRFYILPTAALCHWHDSNHELMP